MHFLLKPLVTLDLTSSQLSLNSSVNTINVWIKTQTAIRKFQSDRGLRPTGAIDYDLLEKLGIVGPRPKQRRKPPVGRQLDEARGRAAQRRGGEHPLERQWLGTGLGGGGGGEGHDGGGGKERAEHEHEPRAVAGDWQRPCVR